MTAIDQEPMFLRPVEAAALAGLSTRAIYRAIQRGELRAVRLCSRLRIPRDGFDEWIAGATVRVEPRVVEVRAIPAARGSFRRRMTRLFEAGFVERFRPQTLRGSYQWT